MAALPVYGKGALTSGASLLIAFASMLQVAFQVLDKRKISSRGNTTLRRNVNAARVGEIGCPLERTDLFLETGSVHVIPRLPLSLISNKYKDNVKSKT